VYSVEVPELMVNVVMTTDGTVSVVVVSVVGIVARVIVVVLMLVVVYSVVVEV
jgi:hypothetical protein